MSKDKKQNAQQKSNAELKQLAMELADGKIFCDRHVSDENLMPVIFMPISLGAFAGEDKKKIMDIGLIYEYLSEAGPRSINGYPIFFSMRTLSKEEARIMIGYYNDWKDLKDMFKNKF